MLPAFLRSYHTTPHCTTGVPPATAFVKRSVRTKLPQIHTPNTQGDSELKLMKQMDSEEKDHIKTYADNHGKAVLNNLGTVFLSVKERQISLALHITVTDRNQSMFTAKNGQKKVTRNSEFIPAQLSRACQIPCLPMTLINLSLTSNRHTCS